MKNIRWVTQLKKAWIRAQSTLPLTSQLRIAARTAPMLACLDLAETLVPTVAENDQLPDWLAGDSGEESAEEKPEADSGKPGDEVPSWLDSAPESESRTVVDLGATGAERLDEIETAESNRDDLDPNFDDLTETDAEWDQPQLEPQQNPLARLSAYGPALPNTRRKPASDAGVRKAESEIDAKAWEDARTTCDKAVLMAPDYSQGYRCRGRVFEAQGKGDAAVEQWLAATEAPLGLDGRLRAWCELAEAFHRRGWTERAQEAITKAKNLDSSSPIPYLGEARLLELQGDREGRIRALEASVDRADDDPEVLLRCADGLFAAGAYGKGAPLYRRLLDQGHGDRYRLAYRAGYGLAQEKQFGLAERYYRQALEIRPDSLWANNNLASALRETGRAEEAVTYHRRALAIESHETCWRNLGFALNALERYGEAEEAFREAHGLNTSNPYNLMWAAWTMAAQDQKNEALEWLDRAVAAGYRNSAGILQDEVFQTLGEKNLSRYADLGSGPWGAIAIKRGSGWGRAHGLPTREAAEQKSREFCGKACKVEVAFTDCAAVARTARGYAWHATGGDLEEVKRRALETCRNKARGRKWAPGVASGVFKPGRDAQTCAIATALCADGTGTN